MEKTIKEIYKSKLVDLGEAMILLLSGKQMTSQQITLISEATDKQIKLALMMRAASTLKGQEYTNYCHNVRKLSRN